MLTRNLSAVLLLIFSISAAFVCHGAKPKVDYYINETGEFVIKIKNDTASIYSTITPWSIHFDQYYELSRCTVKRINRNFLEISSIDRQQPSFYRDKIKCQLSDTVTDPRNDSIYIDVSGGEIQKWNLNYTMQTGSTSRVLDQNSFRLVTTVPDDGVLEFAVNPERYYRSNMVCQLFEIMDFFFDVKTEGHNHLKIDFPFKIEAVFENYYIKQEYVRITPKGLKWRQYDFKKFKPNKKMKRQFK